MSGSILFSHMLAMTASDQQLASSLPGAHTKEGVNPKVTQIIRSTLTGVLYLVGSTKILKLNVFLMELDRYIFSVIVISKRIFFVFYISTILNHPRGWGGKCMGLTGSTDSEQQRTSS